MSTTASGNASNTALSVTSSDGKTLSRNGLYTPLVAYRQSEVPPETYMATHTNSKRIFDSMNESALAAFYHQVSFHYHRHVAGSGDAKNGGSRPNSANEMEANLKRKAVTLIRGVNAALTSGLSSSNKQKNMERKAFRPRKRLRRNWTEVQGKLQALPTDATDFFAPAESTGFLRSMNAAWNAYVSKALSLDDLDLDEESNARVLHGRFASNRSQLELVGAHTWISKCTSKNGLVNKFGVYLGETTNTWKVAMLCQQKASHDGVATSFRINLVGVPKRGSTLSLLIPVDKSGDEEIEEKDMLLPTNKRCIRITLDPDRNHK